MRIKRLLLRLLGFELLAQELVRLIIRGAYHFRTELNKRLAALAFKGTMLLLIVGLMQCALLLGLGGLALYLNSLLESSYEGFLLVSGGCVVLSFLLLLLSRLWR